MFLTHNSNNVKNKLLIAENLLLQAMPGVTSNEEEEILDSIVLQLEYRLMKLAEQKREA